MMSGNSMEKGVQPLDTIMNELSLKNHDLVEASTEQLSHRVVSKGRKGRELTLRAQHKILDALNAAQNEKAFALKDLFNYSGRR